MHVDVVEVPCPTCGEPTAVEVYPASSGTTRSDADCQVCCRPLHVVAQVHDGQVVDAWAEHGW